MKKIALIVMLFVLLPALADAAAIADDKEFQTVQSPALGITTELVSSRQQIDLQKKSEETVETATTTEDDKSISIVGSDLESEQELEHEDFTEEVTVADPLEPWNRAMFTFNDKLYFWVLKPVARGYSAIVPEWGRIRVRNIFQNITMPGRFVNNLLQLKIERAGTELLRFVFNTTVGVGGMFDVAKNIDLKAHEEDLGQTLGVYGIGNGFYLVWPVLGPSSLRDTVGTVGDFFLDPVYYISDTGLRMAVRSLDITNTTSLHIGDYEDIKESALDPYVAFRDAYFQHRNNKVKK